MVIIEPSEGPDKSDCPTGANQLFARRNSYENYPVGAALMDEQVAVFRHEHVPSPTTMSSSKHPHSIRAIALLPNCNVSMLDANAASIRR